MRAKSIVFRMLLGIVVIFAASCGRVKDHSDLSSVREADGATQNLISSFASWSDGRDLSEMSQEEFLGYIYAVNPGLDRDVIRDLTSYKKIEPGERVTLRYHYFDEEGTCRMENAEGKFTKVKFRDEIVVEVIRSGKENFFVALSCLNGMLKIDGSSVVSGDANMKFTIASGQGLSRYLADDYWAINVAEEFGLPLFRGRKMSDETRISPSEARNIDVAMIQVTVYVEEGWTFDLSGQVWTLNGLTAEEFKKI